MQPIDKVLNAIPGKKKKLSGNKYQAHCPAHNDTNPSLVVMEKNGLVLLHCFAGCETKDILVKIGLDFADLVPEEMRYTTPKTDVTVLHSRSDGNTSGNTRIVTPKKGVTLQALCEYKKLNAELLKSYSLTEIRRNGQTCLRIPYYSELREEVAVRFRIGLAGKDSLWRKGDKVTIYGRQFIEEFRQKHGYVILVEGETDCWTLWQYGLPATGVPGKTCWKEEFAELLQGLDVFIWQEPGAEDFTQAIGKSFPGARVIKAPDGIKDPSDAHLQGINVPEFMQKQMEGAHTVQFINAVKSTSDFYTQLRSAFWIFGANKPVALIAKALRKLGYGGDIRTVLLTYIAATTRLLETRAGTMPTHLLLVGLPSSGKSYAVNSVLKLMPKSAYVSIDAASPLALVHGTDDLKHRVLIFSEADSIKSNEDTPAASAMRSLTQEGKVSYDLVVKDEETSDFVVKRKHREGPTVLITTSTTRFKPQMDSRVLTLELNDTSGQIDAALQTQARLEVSGISEPDPALIAYQEVLQGLAPWKVRVPYAKALATLISRSDMNARQLRDYQKLLSLIKASAILNNWQREEDEDGYLLASISDYRLVRDLVSDIYAASNSGGASKYIREVVEVVNRLKSEGTDQVTNQAVADEIGVNKMAASRRIRQALKGGWLINQESRKGYPSDLKIGDPLPTDCSLPKWRELQDCINGVTPTRNTKKQTLTSTATPVTPIPEVLSSTAILCQACGKPAPRRFNILGQWLCGGCRDKQAGEQLAA